LSNFNSGWDDGFGDTVVTTPQPTNKKGKAKSPYQKPPYFLLMIGFIGAPLACLVQLLAPATGSNTILIGFLLWLLSIAAYFVPFGLFTVKDLAGQASLSYLANAPKSKRLRTLLLVEGSICLVFPTYYLASSLASWFTVVFG
jgi:hypothetical protein